jgi:alpha-amylase
MRKVAEKCYLPANEILLKLINKHNGKFKVAFSISGIALNQLRLYAPEVLDSFKKLAETGMVEFLGETFSHSLASLKNREEFEKQIIRHSSMINEFFGVDPVTFRNTELIYSDEIGEWVSEMGFKAVLAEGAKHILGWKSPNFLYCNAANPRLKVLLRNFVLSDDIAFRFANKSWSQWPLTADKYATWIKKISKEGELVNIFVDYETFGEHNWKETGIFAFLEHFPGAIMKTTPFRFMTPAEVTENLQPVSAINVNTPISWADEERDVTAWMGNELQVAAIDKLYSLYDKVKECHDEFIRKNWDYLQASDHFYYMATKFFSDGVVHKYFNPYESPYDAFLNYMNVLCDFEILLKRTLPIRDMEGKIHQLEWELNVKEEKIKTLSKEVEKFKRRSVHRKNNTISEDIGPNKVSSPEKTAVPKKRSIAKKETATSGTKKTAGKATKTTGSSGNAKKSSRK